jgi:dihydropteroate synthase
MMENTKYDNLLEEIHQYFQEKLVSLRGLNIKDIIIDPGLGFSKTLDQNYEILKNLAYFEALGAPLMVGVSRKSMIYNLLDTTPDEALIGTSVANFVALEKGARILRVHDVKEAIETIKIYNKLIS